MEVSGWGAKKEFLPPIIYRTVCLHRLVTLSTTGRKFIEFVPGIKLLARSFTEVSKFAFGNHRKKNLFTEPKISNVTVQRFEDFFLAQLSVLT